MSDEVPATSGPRGSVKAYVAGWVLAGLVTMFVVGTSIADTGGLLVPTTFAAMVGVTVISELLELNFRWGEKATAAFTLVEAGIAASLLLLPPAEAVLATVAAIATVEILRRRAPVKAVFNLGQMTTAIGLAAWTTTLLPGVGPTVGRLPTLSVAAALAVYAAVNFVALIGLLDRLAGQAARETLRDQGWLTAAATTGNTAVGVLLAGLWIERPELAPLLLVPALAIHLAYRGTVRSNTLLGQIRTEHERLDRVVLGTSDGIFLLDRHGTIELWNQAMERMTGIPADEAVGSPVAEILEDDLRDADQPVRGRWLIDSAVPSEPTRHANATVKHSQDGSERIVRESHTFLFDPRGRCTGDVVLVSDVTQQREVESMKGDFVARISHELRTPLTPIKGFAQVLLTRGEAMTDEQRQDALQKIADRAERMTNLVEDLLLVTTIDTSKAEELVTPIRLDLAGLVGRVVGRFRSTYPDRRFYLGTGDGAHEVMADPQRLQQIVHSLLDNAVRYTPEDTPIEVELFDDGDDVGVRIIDHGPGIPLDKKDAIFERFNRLEDPLRMRTGGVGLGLFLSRQLAEAMHGSLDLLPTPGAGATFELRLPSAEPQPSIASVEDLSA